MKRLDRFTADFIHLRQIALEKFLTRVAKHDRLTDNEDFKIFLTAKAWVRILHPSIDIHSIIMYWPAI